MATENEIYTNFVEWNPDDGNDFRRRLASRSPVGVVSTEATQEEWDEAVIKFQQRGALTPL